MALLARYVEGDEAAAGEIFDRYAERLMALTRSRMARKLAARLDPDDVVMSAYRSFFLAARTGRFTLAEPGDLWRLLVEITLHKLYRQVTHHRAARRSVDREATSRDERPDIDEPNAPDLLPEAAVILADELTHLLRRLPPLGRQIVELRLNGLEVDDIAHLIERSPRTVRRQLEQARELYGRGPAESLSPARTLPLPTRTVGEPTRKGRVSQDVAGLFSFSDFLLQRQIGVGVSGKVYRALRRSTGQVVAVKFLRKSYLEDPRVVANFLSEARTVARLSHPGIVRVEGLGFTPACGYFLVLELLPGDLSQRLAQGGIDVTTAVRWVREAAWALDHAHRHGVVHCDVKPSNLLLAADERIVVTDFGFARSLTGAGDCHLLCGGTPAYMAPEQVEAAYGPIGPATDVYGLGAVLFQLLTGRPPYEGRVTDVLANVVSSRPVAPPITLAPSTPSRLSSVCCRALAKLPGERFATAAALAEALIEDAEAAVAVAHRD